MVKFSVRRHSWSIYGKNLQHQCFVIVGSKAVMKFSDIFRTKKKERLVREFL